MKYTPEEHEFQKAEYLAHRYEYPEFIDLTRKPEVKPKPESKPKR